MGGAEKIHPLIPDQFPDARQLVGKPRRGQFAVEPDLGRNGAKDLVEAAPTGRIELAKTVIPSAAVVEQMGLRRAPVVQWAPRSTAGRAYAALWREVADRVK